MGIWFGVIFKLLFSLEWEKSVAFYVFFLTLQLNQPINRIMLESFFVRSTKIIFVLGFVLLSKTLTAENLTDLQSDNGKISIYGLVTDTAGRVVEAAVVTVMDGNGGVLGYALTDSTGHYSVDCSGYAVTAEVSHIVYKTLSKSIILTGAADYRYDFVLEDAEYALEEAVVSADVKIMKMDVDGNLGINAALFPGVERMKTSDMLGRLPGVTYGKSENLSLYGSNATLFVNGVKQMMPAKAIYTYLSSLPAESISEIKLMTNPPARYGNGPVIDIVLKSELSDGSLLDVSAHTEYHNTEISDAGADVFYMFQKNKVVANFMLKYWNMNGFAHDIDSTVVDGFSVWDIRKGGRGNGIWGTSSLSVNFNEKEQLSLFFSGYYDWGKYDMNEYNRRSGSISHEQSSIYRRDKNDMYMYTVSYENNRNPLFHANLVFTGFVGGRSYDSKHVYEFDGSHDFDDEVALHGTMNRLSADMGSTLCEDKLNIEYGAAAEYNAINDKALYFPSDVMMSSDAFPPSSRFKGDELVPSEYFRLRYVFGNFSLTGQAMFQQTRYRIYSDGSALSQTIRYNDFLPKVSLSFKRGLYNGVLTAEKLVERAPYEEMLPGVRRINDDYYTEGNPELKPSRDFRISLYNYIGPVYLVCFYSSFENATGNIYFDRDGIVYRKSVNTADGYFLQANLGFPFKLLQGRLYGQVAGMINYNHYNTLKEYCGIEYGKYQIPLTSELSFYLSFDITERLNCNSDLKYNFKCCDLQKVEHSRFGCDIEVSYAFLSAKQLIVSLGCKNLFNTNNTVTDIFYGSNYAYTKILSSILHGPRVQLSLKYSILKGRNVYADYRDYSPDTSRMKH